jgi:WD40 repeat protein
VKIWDLEMMKPKSNFKFGEAINVAELSPDGNLLAVYGDCVQADILDIRSGETVA